jgi:C_GCAxxG_C_C family probable redox protein
MVSQKTIDAEAMAAAADRYFMVDEKCCGESLLRAGAEAAGIQSDAVPDIAIGFGGGFGLQGHVCGALSGAVLALSLAISRRIKDYPTRKMAAFQAVGRMCKEFEKRFGSVVCRQLLNGLDLTTEAGLKELLATVKAKKCAGFVKDAARILAGELQAIE